MQSVPQIHLMGRLHQCSQPFICRCAMYTHMHTHMQTLDQTSHQTYTRSQPSAHAGAQAGAITCTCPVRTYTSPRSRTCTHLHKHGRTLAHTSAHAHPYTHARSSTITWLSTSLPHKHAHTHMRVDPNVAMHAFMLSDMHACNHMRSHTYWRSCWSTDNPTCKSPSPHAHVKACAVPPQQPAC